MPTFANYSDLRKRAANKRIYVELSNGYFVPVTKQAVKLVADSMQENDVKFCGQIVQVNSERKFIQIKIT